MGGKIRIRIARCLAVCAVLAVALQATTVYAYPQSVERWRPYVHRGIVANHIRGTARAEADIMHCIFVESGGNPSDKYYGCVGLLAFDSGWGTYAQRMNPYWSINRIVRLYAKTGHRGIVKHWCRWHHCGRDTYR